MPLTSLLTDRKSAVRGFFDTHFPRLDVFRKAWRSEVRDLETVAPAAVAGHAWSLVGMAIDYRLRLWYAAYPAESTTAAHGAVGLQALAEPETAHYVTAHTEEDVRALPEGAVCVDMARNVWKVPGPKQEPRRRDAGAWDGLARAWDREVLKRQVIRDLPAADEARVARLCFVMAQFEVYYRSGYVEPILAGARSLDELLEAVPAAAVDDMANLIRLFASRGAGHLDAAQVNLNPTFAGAALVGGADGDLVLDDTLWDFKSTLHPTRDGSHPWAYQLLGYGLLDLRDELRLQGAGVYLVRQGYWRSWTWEEILGLLGADPEQGIQEWRRRFVAAVS